MSFTPSTARTVKVQADGNAFTQDGKFWDMSNPKQPRGLKDPDGTIDVSINWTAWLADCQDTAAAYSWTVDNGAIMVGDDDDGTGTATLFINGGTLGGNVAVKCRMTTSSTPPRVDERTVYLTIENR